MADGGDEFYDQIAHGISKTLMDSRTPLECTKNFVRHAVYRVYG